MTDMSNKNPAIIVKKTATYAVFLTIIIGNKKPHSVT
jgi:hypothetical protein